MKSEVTTEDKVSSGPLTGASAIRAFKKPKSVTQSNVHSVRKLQIKTTLGLKDPISKAP